MCSGQGQSNGDEYVIHDDRAVLEFFAENSGKADFIAKACSNAEFWGEDISLDNDFEKQVSYWYERITTDTKESLKEVLA